MRLFPTLMLQGATGAPRSGMQVPKPQSLTQQRLAKLFKDAQHLGCVPRVWGDHTKAETHAS
jgi:hypothetical protein